MRDTLKRNGVAIGAGLVCLIVGTALASFVTYPIRQGVYHAPGAVTAWFGYHGLAPLAVEWVPAFLHGFVGGIAGMVGGLRVAKGASALLLAAILAVVVVAMAAYALISAGDFIGRLVRGSVVLEALGGIGGITSVCVVRIVRAHRRQP